MANTAECVRARRKVVGAIGIIVGSGLVPASVRAQARAKAPEDAYHCQYTYADFSVPIFVGISRASREECISGRCY